MKKIALSAIACLALIFNAGAQDKHCGATEATNAFLAAHPELVPGIKEMDQKFWDRYYKEEKTAATKKTSGTVYIIPVVFHIVHNYGVENISDAQILDEIQILNTNYRRLNADTSLVIQRYKNNIADIEIEFRLAQKDPNGNCTNGIDRIASLTTNNAGDNAKLNQWDPKKYLNIWVVRSLANQQAAAYAYKPGTANSMPSIDGIISRYNYIGSIGTSSPYTSKTITHEIGHYLNLSHVWGDGTLGTACTDDGITDTPPTHGWDHCPADSTVAKVCNASIAENYQNYMEYSYCTEMFTAGQKGVMRLALTGYPNRSELWTAANLAATGTDGSPAVQCAPVSDFILSSTFTGVCEGSDLQFFDKSWRGATSWQWSFPGADVTTSNVQNPVVHYSTGGVYDVSLTTTNAAGSNTFTRKGYVNIVPKIAWYGMPFSDDFTNHFIGTGWSEIPSQSDTLTTWTKFSSYVKLNNFDVDLSSGSYALASPRLDMSRTVNATLSFKFSYAVKTSASTGDILKLYYSIDCGKTWSSFATYNLKNLSTANGLYPNAFTPTKSSQWFTQSVAVPHGLEGKTPVIFKFEFTKVGGGNNFYLDDFLITGTTAVNENALADISLNIFPNPSENTSTLSFNLPKNENVSIRVYDLVGREVQTILNEKKLNAGDNKFEISLPVKGVYFVKTKVGNTEATKKLVIN